MSSFSELVELVNVANPAAQVQLTTAMVLVKSVTHNAPLVQGRDTTAVLSGISSAGVGGDSPVYYNRLSTPTIFAGIDVQLQLSDKPRTRNQMVAELNTRYGCDFDPTDFVDSICAANATSYNLEARVDAIKFTGVLAIALVASLSLAELIKVPTLAGFNYPVNEVVGGLRPTKIGDVIFTANSELTLAGNTYRLLSVDKPVELTYSDWPVLGRLNPPVPVAFKHPLEIQKLGTARLADNTGMWLTVKGNSKVAYMLKPQPGKDWVETDIVVDENFFSGYAVSTEFTTHAFIFIKRDWNNGTVLVSRIQTKQKMPADWGALESVWTGESGDSLPESSDNSMLAGQVATNNEMVAFVVHNGAGAKPRVAIVFSSNEGATWKRLEVPEADVLIGGNGNPLPFFVNIDGSFVQFTNGRKYWRASHSATSWDNVDAFDLPRTVNKCVGIASQADHRQLVILGENPLMNFAPSFETPNFLDLPGADLKNPNSGRFYGRELHVYYENGIAVWRWNLDGGGNSIYGELPNPEVRYRFDYQQDRGYGYLRYLRTNDEDWSGFVYNVVPVGSNQNLPTTTGHDRIENTVTVPAYPNSNGWAKVVADPKP